MRPPPTLFVSLELSRSKWLVTSLSPGNDKMSKHAVAGGDGNALLVLLHRLAAKAFARVGKPVKIVSLYEAGLDGFSVHRLLERNEVASHVVDPASIAVPRRARRAKTDSIDVETMLRTLWHGNAASRASVRWSYRRCRKKKIGGGSHANAKSSRGAHQARQPV
jgi:hypothetical protein